MSTILEGTEDLAPHEQDLQEQIKHENLEIKDLDDATNYDDFDDINEEPFDTNDFPLDLDSDEPNFNSQALDKSLDVNQYTGPDDDYDDYDLEDWTGDEPGESKSSLDLNTLYQLLAIDRKFVMLESKLIDENHIQISTVKFSTPYKGQHDYVQIVYNWLSHNCDVTIQYNKNVITKTEFTQQDVIALILSKIPEVI